MILFRPDPRDRKLVIGMDEEGMKMFHEAMKKAVKKYKYDKKV